MEENQLHTLICMVSYLMKKIWNCFLKKKKMFYEVQVNIYDK